MQSPSVYRKQNETVQLQQHRENKILARWQEPFSKDISRHLTHLRRLQMKHY